MPYNSDWIKKGATPAMVRFAEEEAHDMVQGGLTRSKIRNIYGEIKRIQMGDFEKEKSAFYLLKPKMAYTLGREANNQGLRRFKNVFDRAWNDVTDQRSFKNFCNLMEAILAYHRAQGGRD